jgi:putative ABC transport system permease protein
MSPARRLARWVVAAVPQPLRDAFQADGTAMLADVFDAAYRRRGWRGVMLAGAVEWFDLARAAIRARLGVQPRITGGSAPDGRRPRTPRPSRALDGGLVGRLRNDIRLVWRSMNAARTTTSIAAATLAIGIGVNTTVFSVLDAILLRPVPYAEADRLETLWTQTRNQKNNFHFRGGMSPAWILEWRRQTDLFDRVEASESKSYIYQDERGAEMISGAVVTPGLIGMLGVQPIAGRPFTGGDGRDGTDRLVLISERFWRERLHRRSDAVRMEITLDGDLYRVIGILPRTFRFPSDAHEIWIPLDLEHPPVWARPVPGAGIVAEGRTARRAGPSLEALVRLQPGLTRDQVHERVVARGADLHVKAGGDGRYTAWLYPLGQLWDSTTERSLNVLGGAVVFLLLIVCANVANLTLSRSMARAHDRTVRTALGASRGDLIREALVEHTAVGAIGALLGLGVAKLAIAATVGVLPETMTLSSLNAVDLDGRALAFLAAVSALTVLLFGVPPALLSARTAVADALRRETRSSTGSASARRFHAALVIAEVALSLVLLVGAALMTRSLLRLQATDIGIDTRGLIALRLGMPTPAYSAPEAREIFVGELLYRLQRDPDVASASAGPLPPRESQVGFGPIEFADRPGEKTNAAVLRVYDVWPRFFATAGIELQEGRDFTPQDVAGATIVSRNFAAKHWPGRSPLGMRYRVGESSWRTIIGVAEEVRGMGEEHGSDTFEIYYAHGDLEGLSFPVRPSSRIADYETVVIRARQPGVVIGRLSAIVHGIDSSVVVSRTQMVEHQFADQIARPRTVFWMLSVFAGFGLVLAAAGLYGVMSYLVSQRQREIGIRLALGATPRDVGRLVFGRGVGLAAVGVVIGLGGSFWLVRVMQTLLYHVDARDPVSIVAVSALLLGTAAIAAWGPARRAMRVDPVTLLREE